MKKTLHTIRLKAPITIAYRKVKNLHICNALEFDIVGTGDSKEAAYTQVKELIEEYLLAVVESVSEGKKVDFFNPASDDEWNNCKELRQYRVTFIVDVTTETYEVGPLNLSDLSPFHNSVRGVDLVPA